MRGGRAGGSTRAGRVTGTSGAVGGVRLLAFTSDTDVTEWFGIRLAQDNFVITYKEPFLGLKTMQVS